MCVKESRHSIAGASLFQGNIVLGEYPVFKRGSLASWLLTLRYRSFLQTPSLPDRITIYPWRHYSGGI